MQTITLQLKLVRSEVFQSGPIVLSSTHASSLLRIALICTLYFIRKTCEKKNKSTQKSTHLIAKAIHSQWCHYKHSLFATKGQADGRKRIAWLEIQGRSVFRAGKQKATAFLPLSLYLLFSPQTKISSGFALLFRDLPWSFMDHRRTVSLSCWRIRKCQGWSGSLICPSRVQILCVQRKTFPFKFLKVCDNKRWLTNF